MSITCGAVVSASLADDASQLTQVVLGYANDLLPYVGEHPEKPGVFIAAGFTGHGQSRSEHDAMIEY